MTRVLMLSRYGRLGASSRLRSYQYVPYLEDHGFQVKIKWLLGNDYVRGLYNGRIPNASVLKGYIQRLGCMLRAGNFDLVWVEKEMLPWIPAWIELGLLRGDVPVAVDYDDALYHRYDQHRSPLVRRLLGRKIDAIMRHSNLVIAGNEYLREHAERAGARLVKLLPTVVDLKRYTTANISSSDPFTIGWIGTPATSRYLDLVMPALREVLASHGVRVVAIGASRAHLLNTPIEVRAWSEENEIMEIQKCDVGIMPLPDLPWERGKCGYKLIQYMACGIPVVASPVGVNKDIVEHGVNGFLANTNDEWMQALSMLRDQPEMRRAMGMEGRAKVERQYSLQVAAPKLHKLLSDVVGL